MMRKLTSGANLLASSSNSDDDALTPALVTSLECASHDVHVTSAIKGVVTTTVGHLNQLLLNGLTVLEILGVHKVGSAKLVSPVLLGVVDVNDDDFAGAVLDTSLNDGETNTASAKDGNVGTLLHTTLAGSNDSCAVTSGDAAAEQAGAVHRGLVGDWNDGDVGDNGVLREGGGAHEV